MVPYHRDTLLERVPVRTSVADPDDFGPDPDPIFDINRIRIQIRIRPLKKMRIRILPYVKFCIFCIEPFLL
jgi:hypothetical protein